MADRHRAGAASPTSYGTRSSSVKAGGGPHPSLRGHRSFADVYRTGVRRRCGDVTVFAAPAAPGPARVGVVAGRRVGTAVRRNRAKRRLRAVLSGRLLPPDMAYVVVAGPEVPVVAYDRLGEWVAKALEATGAPGPQEET